MKKLFIAILSMLYLAASTGATVQLHYCMGKLADAGLFHEETGPCSLCGMEKSTTDKKGCCHDKQETVKISIDQKYSTSTLFHFEQPSTILPSVFNGIQPEWKVVAENKIIPVSNAPPRSPQVPEYLMHCHLSI